MSQDLVHEDCHENGSNNIKVYEISNQAPESTFRATWKVFSWCTAVEDEPRLCAIAIRTYSEIDVNFNIAFWMFTFEDEDAPHMLLSYL